MWPERLMLGQSRFGLFGVFSAGLAHTPQFLALNEHKISRKAALARWKRATTTTVTAEQGVALGWLSGVSRTRPRPHRWVVPTIFEVPTGGLTPNAWDLRTENPP